MTLAFQITLMLMMFFGFMGAGTSEKKDNRDRLAGLSAAAMITLLITLFFL